MINEQYKYSELTSKIIGCAMTVHKTLGNACPTVSFRRACSTVSFRRACPTVSFRRACPTVSFRRGFQEVIYQRALAIEMHLAGLKFSREFEMPIFYREEQIGTRRVDFLVEDVVSVELKAITKLEDVHFAQAINYLEAYNLEIGLLINFGEMSLNFKRLNNKKFKS